MTEPTQTTSIVAAITGKDLLDKFENLNTTLGDLRRVLDDVPAHVADHENRIRTLEQNGWKRQGATALLASLLSSGCVALIIELLKARGH